MSYLIAIRRSDNSYYVKPNISVNPMGLDKRIGSYRQRPYFLWCHSQVSIGIDLILTGFHFYYDAQTIIVGNDYIEVTMLVVPVPANYPKAFLLQVFCCDILAPSS